MLFLNFGSGRGISHTFLFVILGYLILHIASKKKSHVSLPFLIGMLFHLVLDLPEVPLFYPFIMYDFLILEDPLGYWIYVLFNDPVVYMTELLGISLLVFIVIRNKLYNLEIIKTFLIEKSQKFDQDL